MRLSKQEIVLHKQACKLLKKNKLTFEEKVFVLENWNEGAEYINSISGAFFTPFQLARDFELDVQSRSGCRIIDLCAGIGALSLAVYESYIYEVAGGKASYPEIVCVEINPGYIEIGKKICPEATWVHGSIFDRELIESLGKFDAAICNPPFGNIKTENVKNWLKYTGSSFEFKAIELASKIAKTATFIIPRMSSPFTRDQHDIYTNHLGKESLNPAIAKFINQTNIDFLENIGINCDFYIRGWKGVQPHVEIVCFDFEEQENTDDDIIFPEKKKEVHAWVKEQFSNTMQMEINFDMEVKCR
jgi:phospholipid N-methyltransferase